MYYPNTNAILYVVDSHDKARFAKAAEELSKVLEVFFGRVRKKFCKECHCWYWPTNRTSRMQPLRRT